MTMTPAMAAHPIDDDLDTLVDRYGCAIVMLCWDTTSGDFRVIANAPDRLTAQQAAELAKGLAAVIGGGRPGGPRVVARATLPPEPGLMRRHLDLIVEEATTDDDRLVGYRVRLIGVGGPAPLKCPARVLVFADQAAMPGLRAGDAFVPGWNEELHYREVCWWPLED